MPNQIELRRSTINEIVDLLTKEDFVSLCTQATGKNPLIYFAQLDDTYALAFARTMEKLQDLGWERWFLTYVLIAKASEKLRGSIVDAWPNTLVRLPQAEDQVVKALTYLNAVLKVPLSIDLKFGLGDKRRAFEEILGRIAALCAYKNLHEYLHQLDLKLTFGGQTRPANSVAPDFNSMALRCDDVVQNAPTPASLLGAGSDDEANELRWIAQLKTSAASLKSAAAASDMPSCAQAIGEIQTFVRFHLKRLNGKVFEAATALSFDALMQDLPSDVTKDGAFDNLVSALRDFKPTVMARALKHNLWQETENDFLVLESFFNVSGDEVADIGKPWFALKKRVLWLAALDPDDPWAKQAREFSDEIDDAILNKRKLDDDIRADFERYRNLFRFRFLAVDNTMKMDCGSLSKIDGPLTEILKELAS
jgi:hypothetical protein